MLFSKRKILCIFAILAILGAYSIQQNISISSLNRQLLIAKIRANRLLNSTDREATNYEHNQNKTKIPLTDSKSMRDWSIRSKYKPGMDPLIEPHRTKLPDSELNKEAPFLLSLRRPDAKNIISRFKMGPGSVELNPRDSYQGITADYGPIPPLEKMTCNDAENLWGNGKVDYPIQSYQKSFQLISNDYISAEKEAFLDVSFKDNHVTKYRLRFPGYESPWRTVRGGWPTLTTLLLVSLLAVAALLKLRF